MTVDSSVVIRTFNEERYLDELLTATRAQNMHGAASETFSQKNINCSIAESLKRFAPVVAQARARAIRVRGYVSCVMGCPYEGDVEPKRVDEVASALLEMGCYEVSLGDTIGVGTPEKTAALLAALSVPTQKLAAHFHNTYGRAVPNLAVALSVRGGAHGRGALR